MRKFEKEFREISSLSQKEKLKKGERLRKEVEELEIKHKAVSFKFILKSNEFVKPLEEIHE